MLLQFLITTKDKDTRKSLFCYHKHKQMFLKQAAIKPVSATYPVPHNGIQLQIAVKPLLCIITS